MLLLINEFKVIKKQFFMCISAMDYRLMSLVKIFVLEVANLFVNVIDFYTLNVVISILLKKHQKFSVYIS